MLSISLLGVRTKTSLTMTTPSTFPQRTELIDGFEIPRIVTGLWQVADMERDGQSLNIDAAAAALAEYADAGFDAFDVADHDGSAELIAGRFLQNFSVDVSLVAGRRANCPPSARKTM
jgi:aryl-alcohol dehydrogenase-like predicted oxidoreductase